MYVCIGIYIYPSIYLSKKYKFTTKKLNKYTLSILLLYPLVNDNNQYFGSFFREWYWFLPQNYKIDFMIIFQFLGGFLYLAILFLIFQFLITQFFNI